MKKLQLVAVLLLAGCQTGPVPAAFKPGTNASQRQADYDQCKIASLREIPQAMATQVSGGVYTPGSVQCRTIGTITSCSESGGLNIPATATTYDANHGLRDRFINRCMMQKGYSILSRPACSSESERLKAATMPQPANPADYKCTPGINMDG
ncbi:hypothetical protein [Mesorhizobium loti]|uniref:hypothetical protein n=1 Tax=Rhizobium loti TaxID=381 RepID=UPI0012BC3E6C|nr:hypothetical protein [Mesorhizobium loti]